VKDPNRRDYLEAASILDLSPRMSAVLSRRILGVIAPSRKIRESMDKKIDAAGRKPISPAPGSSAGTPTN
jgi:hypothetical protein